MKTFDWREIEESELLALPDALVSELIQRRMDSDLKPMLMREVFGAMNQSQVASEAHPLALYDLAREIVSFVSRESVAPTPAANSND